MPFESFAERPKPRRWTYYNTAATLEMAETNFMPSDAASIRPLTLRKRGDDGLIIHWSDGHESLYTWQRLREKCPCASCRGEWGQPPDPFRILKPSEMAPRPPIAAVQMTPVGHYAYKVTWNDGHDTGIYTLESLRELCECELCEHRRRIHSQPPS